MIVLDTNVVSEVLRPKGSPTVEAWLDAQLVETLHLTSITLAELSVGIALLPHGRRRDGLGAALDALISRFFAGRILRFDEQAARIYAAIVSGARAKGRIVSFADGQIAATATSHGFAVATRDAAPFVAAGVAVIDPWTGIA